MADERNNEAAAAKKGLKGVITIAALLIVEAAVIVGVMLLVSSEPDVAVADSPLLDPELAAMEKIEEILVLDGRLPNDKTGPTMLYQTEVFAQVKRKHTERVNDHLSQFQNEIKFDITTIWKNSEPRHFKEPRLESLTRKVGALLHERFGTDEATGEPVLQKVVIVMGTGFRMDL